MTLANGLHKFASIEEIAMAKNKKKNSGEKPRLQEERKDVGSSEEKRADPSDLDEKVNQGPGPLHDVERGVFDADRPSSDPTGIGDTRI
jgi:hypothetical protein